MCVHLNLSQTMELHFQGSCLQVILSYVHSIPDSFCASTKNVLDGAFVHTLNSDFGSTFVPGRCCAASVLKVNPHVLDRFS